MEYLKNINEAIKNYLKTEKTDYAILINGAWGSGKTYYFKNNIKNIINKIENKEYRYIYISLYGINNFEEITKNIMWQVATNTKSIGIGNKTKFFGSKIATFVSDVGFGKLGIESNPLKDFLDKSEDLNLENVILCFDDLERSHLSPNKVFGYINDFVEHQNIKTFIIGHEKKLEEIFIKENIENKWDIALNWIDLKRKNIEEVSKKEIKKEIKDIFSEYNFYKQIKEKLIGKTIDFKPKNDYYDNKVLNNIIFNFNNENYKQFIKSNKNEIIKIFELNEYNIRSLKHSLDDFYIIYDEFNGKISTFLLEKIFYFTLICTFENKNHKIQLEKIKEFSYNDVYTSYLFNTSKIDNALQKFFTKYFDVGIKFEKINSIIDYVISGYINIDLLNEEIIKLKAKKSKSNFELIEQFWKLSDDKFEEVLKSLTDELKNGEYKVSKYLKIFKKYATLHYLGLLDFNLNELKQLFEEGIEKSLKKNEPENFIDSFLFPSEQLDQRYDKIYEEIAKTAKEKNKEFKKSKNKEKLNKIFETKKEYEILRDFVQSIDNNNFYSYVDNKKLVNYLKEKNNEELNEIINLLIDRIDRKKSIKEKLRSLKFTMDKEFDFDNKKLSIATIKRLYSKIEELIVE